MAAAKASSKQNVVWLTGGVVPLNAETERRECGSVEVAYDVDRVGPVSGLLETVIYRPDSVP